MIGQPYSRGIVAGAGIVVLSGLLLAGRSLGAELPAVTARLEALGALAPLGFIVAYLVATVAFVPGSLLTLAGGALFGVVRGTAFVLIGATLGATAAFLLGRYGIRRKLEPALRASPRFAALDSALRQRGWLIVLLLRLSPIVPFNLLNYALGASGVRLRDFLLASIGMLPGTLLYVYYGKVAGAVATLAVGGGPPRGAGYYVVLGLGLMATVAVSVIITRAARRTLASAERAANP